MEEASLFLGVVGQAVGELVGIGEVHHHDGPFETLDTVHRGEQNAGGIAFGDELGSQPGLEGAGVGMERRQLQNGLEVVALGRAVHAVAAVVEGGDRAGQVHLVDEGGDDAKRRRALGRHDPEPVDVGCEAVDAVGVAIVVESFGQLVEIFDAVLFGHPVGDAGVERSRRPT